MNHKAIDEIREFINQKALEFGAKPTSSDDKSYIERKNVSEDSFKDNGAYFGLIQPYEENSGVYHDFSLVIFPSMDNEPWLLCLGVGSQGFKNDQELAYRPGLRRLFSKLVDEDGFCKSDLSDTQTGLPNSIIGNPQLTHIRNTIKRNSNVLPVCQILSAPTSTEGKEKIAAFLAAYAKIRDWATNNNHRNAIVAALSKYVKAEINDDETQVFSLIKERKYVILQGAPGTGKTRLAKKISERLEAKTIFTQFHAETTYSDFIYGIRPKLNSDHLSYTESKGPLVAAISHALKTKENTVLIIDEINRANLSNVLGPIFYLFEHKQDSFNVEIEITPELKISKMPDNLIVIGTMNTADRSLAVVDFALRRRFAWYDVKPYPIDARNFHKKEFESIASIFEWHANSNELNLQPGQGYFIAESEEEMTNRLRYEIYPLIREYIQEGILLSAKEEFNDFFTKRISKSLFE